jgi:hypothetical protein
VNKRITRILTENKRKMHWRLRRKQYDDQPKAMFKGGNIKYSISEKVRAIGYGGIGAMHTLVRKLKLDRSINRRIHFLKAHLPYHESDHVLNIAYNVMAGGTCLEDIERLRQDDTYTEALGAERIPDPTTAGDFLRRFDAATIGDLQEVFNDTRRKVWALQGEEFRREAIIDVDGTIAPTTGECKGGMDIAYNGVWGYAPLIITLAHTGEALYLVNRPGSRPSCDGAAEWMDRAIDLTKPVFKRVWLRGDTDFSLTANFDRWDEQGVGFVFGYDAKQNLVTLAEGLPEKAWKKRRRPAPYTVKTEVRERPERVKERIVREREFQNIRLESEQVTEFEYRPTGCRKDYRMVVVRKNLSVEKGEAVLFADIRYFFYITNDRARTATEVVLFANGRCNQENVIAQLKSGVNALRMPADDLVPNWAYMVIAALAWNLKAWFALQMPPGAQRQQALRMEFKRFLVYFMLLPCQILKAGRKLVYRILGYNDHLEAFFATVDRIRALGST